MVSCVVNVEHELQENVGRRADMSPMVNMTWENLTYRVSVKGAQKKTLLHNVSGTALGGRVLAIMGPSGAGKTTLMSAITGRLSNTEKNLEGCCFLNNAVYTEHYKGLVSFVAQDDIVMALDTPREAAYFACRVRLGLSKEESNKLVDGVIERLHLTQCQNTILGIPGLLKGVSGGERKRANVASALVTNPCVIVLDEPTTGLDSVNALRVGQMLQELAKREKRTVIATVHSPSSELVETFDDLLLLSKGHVVYHGPREGAADYFASHGYIVPPCTNPCEYFMEILQQPDSVQSALWAAWDNYVESPAALSNPCMTKVQNPQDEDNGFLRQQLELKGSNSWIQLIELTTRAFRTYPRHPSAVFVRVVQTLFVALITGLFYFRMTIDQGGVKDRLGLLFFTVVNAMFASAMHGITAYPPERAVFLLEQSTDSYSALMYVLGKFIAEVPFQIVFPTAFVIMTYFMVNLYNSVAAFFVYWFILVQHAITSYVFGMMFATFFKSPTTSFSLVPVVFIPLLIVTGLYANTERLDPYWLWLSYISFPRFAFMGTVLNEFGRLEKICDPPTADCWYTDGHTVIEMLGFEHWSYWMTFLAMLAYTIVLLLITALSLFIQGRQSKGKLVFKRNLAARSSASA
ncbi:putative ABC transporter ABC 2 type transporter [Trypanosoma vivax]|uniref:Putative ABC transporter n=1 Tax=Trypanosoma vivax (strain Y486) TaxID=1055687 RepID=G0U2A9_TRYVY|nr:putative ABC transporter [Trypanosoma vivax]KAH8611259.1 putative ABC transporter ABC 2 type transporter [Trypanosoma vivax]KAH8620787.1 putative ABC transporter ABC 2 type transporter [Trypanosoma vivax]CCC50412.1 putative ABC transporter [Trypanosoma vivax Y486]